jgi:hypothetical protein
MFRNVNCVGAERAHANGYIGSVADDVDTSGWANDADGHRQSPRGSDTAGDDACRRRHRCVSALRSRDPRQGDWAVSDPDVVATLAAERVADLRHQIDYLASTVALLPASPRRAAARAAVQTIDRDIAELLRYLSGDDPANQPPTR